MKVGILGSGSVAQSLAHGLVQGGHEVRFGTRDPGSEKLSDWRKQHPRARVSVGSYAEAAEFGELVIIATLGVATPDALEAAGPGRFRGKTVLDATNPLLFPGEGPPTLSVGHTDSEGEQVQRLLPQARVVKVFNTIGNAHFFQPRFPDGPPTMFICGNDARAKREVSRLLGDFGWSDVVDVGGIERSRELEPLCVLWIAAAMALDNYNIAFRLLRK